jgi:hypothetical protein
MMFFDPVVVAFNAVMSFVVMFCLSIYSLKAKRC